MNTDELHRVYEARALLDQALSILIQANESIKALQPPRKPGGKMTKEEMLQQFRTLLEGKSISSVQNTKKTKKGAK